MNQKFWQIVAIVVLVLIALTLYWTRYQVVTANYAYAPAFYKINRITGEVTLTVGKEFVAVEGIAAPRPGEPSGAPGAPRVVPAPPAPQPPQPPQPSQKK